MMVYVVDIRDWDVCWSGTKKECREWISMSSPRNKPYYRLARINEEKEMEIL